MTASPSMASAVEVLSKQIMKIQSNYVELFLTKLRTVPMRLRPTGPAIPGDSTIDERLDIFSQFYWDLRYWPGRGMGIPDTANISALEELDSILPSLYQNKLWGLTGLKTPASNEMREEYASRLFMSVLARADTNRSREQIFPQGLPSDYVDLLCLTDGFGSRDILHAGLCNFTGVLTAKELREWGDTNPQPHILYAHDDDWETSAAFRVSRTGNVSECWFIFGRSLSEDASLQEREWSWKVIFFASDASLRDKYVGDLTGFLKFYPTICKQDRVELLVRRRFEYACKIVQDDKEDEE